MLRFFKLFDAFWIICSVLLVLTTLMLSQRERSGPHRQTIDCLTIELPDTLRVVTLSGATTYFTIQGEEMGYQYELLRLYSEAVGLPFKVTLAPNLDSLHSLLYNGEAHLSITPEAVIKEDRKPWVSTGPSIERSMVLVQRRKRGARDSTYINNVTELLGKPLYVLSDSHYEQRMKHLGEQLGQNLDIRYIASETTNAEDLIAQVSADSIDYAIVNGELAQLARPYYNNIDYKLKVGFPQRLRWLSTDRNLALLESLDRWAEQVPKLQRAKNIYKKYFRASLAKSLDYRGGRSSLTKGEISPYDSLFRRLGNGYSWSWHLLPAIAYQESRFRPDIIGWSGARGLMGIMPSTGRAYGVHKADLLDPQNSIKVAILCLQATESAFSKIPDDEERLLFTLAGYNAGIGHVQDAQRLARKYGAKSDVWRGEVERFILLKSESKYYNDSVCRYGYLRGREAYEYAREVYARYKHYQSL